MKKCYITSGLWGLTPTEWQHGEGEAWRSACAEGDDGRRGFGRQARGRLGRKRRSAHRWRRSDRPGPSSQLLLLPVVVAAAATEAQLVTCWSEVKESRYFCYNSFLTFWGGGRQSFSCAEDSCSKYTWIGSGHWDFFLREDGCLSIFFSRWKKMLGGRWVLNEGGSRPS